MSLKAQVKPINSFKSLLAALETLQGQYTLLKKRAEEKERTAEREIASLTLKVASLEKEVTDLEETIMVEVKEKISTVLALQTDFTEFEWRSDHLHTKFLDDTRLLQNRIDGLQTVVQTLKEPIPEASTSSFVNDLSTPDLRECWESGSSDPGSPVLDFDIPKPQVNYDPPISLKVYLAAPKKSCPLGHYTPTLTASHDTDITDAMNNLYLTLPAKYGTEFRLWKVPARSAKQEGWYYPVSGLGDNGGIIADHRPASALSSLRSGEAIVIEPKLERWLTAFSRDFTDPPPPPRVIRS